MKKQQGTLISTIIAALALSAGMFAWTAAEAQVRLNPTPLPSMSINSACQDDVAVFKIRNGLQPWVEPGEIVVIAEQERRIVSRRKMRFASNQKASYRVPLSGSEAVQGPLRIVLLLGNDAKTPVAHARLDCSAG